jgi:hypothetical protein
VNGLKKSTLCAEAETTEMRMTTPITITRIRQARVSPQCCMKRRLALGEDTLVVVTESS